MFASIVNFKSFHDLSVFLLRNFFKQFQSFHFEIIGNIWVKTDGSVSKKEPLGKN